MRYPFLRTLALVAGFATALAPAARAQEKPAGPATAFSYNDPETTGRLYLYDLGPDDATGGQSIQVQLWRGQALYVGSGFTYQINPEMPFNTLISFAVQGPGGVTLSYQGTIISGITVSGSGTFHRPRTPDVKQSWSIVIGVAEPATSGIQGVAIVGPIYPIERPGVINEGPLADALIIAQTTSGEEVARVRADKNGRFKLGLAPGNYRIVPLPSDPESFAPRAEPFKVTVRAKQFLNLRIKYQNFIR